MVQLQNTSNELHRYKEKLAKTEELLHDQLELKERELQESRQQSKQFHVSERGREGGRERVREGVREGKSEGGK